MNMKDNKLEYLCPQCKLPVTCGTNFCVDCGARFTWQQQTTKHTNWFARHCNWVLILEWLGVPTIIVFIAGIIHSYYPFDFSNGILVFSFIMITLILFLATASWMLKVKNRSLWNLFYLLLGVIGFIILLCLENKTDKY